MEAPSEESGQMHRFLRLHLRSLFLDFCAESDQSMWVSIVFDPANRSESQVAQLLILLYAPILQGGTILNYLILCPIHVKINDLIDRKN